MSSWFSINTDGAVHGWCSATWLHGTTGCGGVLKDHRGVWIGGFAKNIGTSNVFFAELWGAYEGLCLASQRDLRNVSLTVVRNLEGENIGS
ncbi:hypothetical protein L195_g017591 [Trifolium pratense]|uniref:RNase H type-1 domain-containing protein n=1 Tax=Trifolium pratense TaxID=57577 RepID=A0A2K3MUI6_TRIPR|nr:hypothetical protein L195_g017591 [Trifolium pratense]